MAEKLIVSRWLRPALKPVDICDQFAFRPTGSTTAALTFGIHHITKRLETSRYVRCFLIDFRKAFDTVNHEIIIKKLKYLKLPPHILNWIINFLTPRAQQVKLCGTVSNSCSITRSIIQGSVLGPTLYIIMESDLHPMSAFINLLFKFADDTTLIVPEITDISAKIELLNIKTWAFQNLLEINWDKCNELVFNRPNISHDLIHAPFVYIERVNEARLLGITISGKLNFTSHVNYLMSVCSQRLFLLKSLRQQGLRPNELQTVFNAIIINCIMYALPTWAGYLSVGLINKINAFFRKCTRLGYTKSCYTFTELMAKADDKFFRSLQMNHHCAHFLLPPHKAPVRCLRPHWHNLELPTCKYELFKKSFICRYLYGTKFSKS